MGNRFALQQAPLHQVDLLDHHGVEVVQLLSPHQLQQVLRDRQRLNGREHFLLETVTVLHIRRRGRLLALFLIGAAPVGQPPQPNHLTFEFAPPVLALAPAAQAGRLDHRQQQVRTFALGVP